MIKIIVSTVLATISSLSVAGVIFLNGILGMFGLAVTSAETLVDLKTSQQIVQTMRKRHKSKKIKVSKKFVKRTGKKIASSAVAAATIGTAAVVATVATLEVHSYCEDKKELHEDGNVLNGRNDEFDYKACVKEATDDAELIVASVRDSVTESVSKIWGDTKNYTSDKWDATKQSGSDAWKRTKASTENLWKSLVD